MKKQILAGILSATMVVGMGGDDGPRAHRCRGFQAVEGGDGRQTDAQTVKGLLPNNQTKKRL